MNKLNYVTLAPENLIKGTAVREAEGTKCLRIGTAVLRQAIKR
jgi:hypothetical protein